MHDPFQLPAPIDHHQRSNLLLFHQSQRGRGKFASPNRPRILRHRLARRQIEHIFSAFLKQPPQISIADDAHQRSPSTTAVTPSFFRDIS